MDELQLEGALMKLNVNPIQIKLKEYLESWNYYEELILDKTEVGYLL